jgi:hypothetical protein
MGGFVATPSARKKRYGTFGWHRQIPPNHYVLVSQERKVWVEANRTLQHFAHNIQGFVN